MKINSDTQPDAVIGGVAVEIKLYQGPEMLRAQLERLAHQLARYEARYGRVFLALVRLGREHGSG